MQIVVYFLPSLLWVHTVANKPPFVFKTTPTDLRCFYLCPFCGIAEAPSPTVRRVGALLYRFNFLECRVESAREGDQVVIQIVTASEFSFVFRSPVAFLICYSGLLREALGSAKAGMGLWQPFAQETFAQEALHVSAPRGLSKNIFSPLFFPFRPCFSNYPQTSLFFCYLRLFTSPPFFFFVYLPQRVAGSHVLPYSETSPSHESAS